MANNIGNLNSGKYRMDIRTSKRKTCKKVKCSKWKGGKCQCGRK